MKVYRNLPAMHARNDIPLTARQFQRFLQTCLLQAHISFWFAADSPFSAFMTRVKDGAYFC